MVPDDLADELDGSVYVISLLVTFDETATVAATRGSFLRRASSLSSNCEPSSTYMRCAGSTWKEKTEVFGTCWNFERRCLDYKSSYVYEEIDII